MAAVVSHERWPEVEETCRRWEVDAHRHRRDHRHRPPALLPRRRAGRRHPGERPHRRLPALRGRAHAPGPPPRRPARLQQRGQTPILRCGRSSARPTSGAGGGCSASTTTWSDRAPRPPRRRCGGRAAHAVAAGDRRLARRQRPAHLARPAPGRDERRLRSSSERRLHGRPPSHRHQLPRLRNPETARVGYELAEAIEGMALACEALGLPVVSGNVSLYNEHHGRPIHPTPVVGVVGVLDDASLAVGTRLPRGGGRRADRRRRPRGPSTARSTSEVIDGTTDGRIPEPDLDRRAPPARAARRRGRARPAPQRPRRVRRWHRGRDRRVAMLGSIGVDAPGPRPPVRARATAGPSSLAPRVPGGARGARRRPAAAPDRHRWRQRDRGGRCRVRRRRGDGAL